MPSQITSINPVAFTIGSWPVHWYGIILGLAGLVGYFVFIREAGRKEFDTDLMFDFIFWAIIWGLVGARLYYVVFSWNYYRQHPDQIIAVWNGGLAIYGGVIGGVLAIYILSKRHQQSFISILDMAAPALMIGQAIGRWANFINQEAHGGPVERATLERLLIPDWIIGRMYINGQYWHPTFLYESVWNVLGFVLLLILRRRPQTLRQGHLVAFYMIWYGLGRMVIEGMRMDSLYLGPLRVSQWLSGILIILGLALWIWQNRHEAIYYEEAQASRVNVKEA